MFVEVIDECGAIQQNTIFRISPLKFQITKNEVGK